MIYLFNCARYLTVASMLLIVTITFSQNCESSITILLKNKTGGVFANQTITLTSKAGDIKFELISNQKGEAPFTVPCNMIFDLSISNYTKKKEIKIPENPVQFTRTISYESDMAKKENLFALDSLEMAEVDKTAATLQDTFYMKGSAMAAPASPKHFTRVNISIKDLLNGPLSGEKVCITGEKRNKNIVGITGPNGKLIVYLAKGDILQHKF